MWVTPCCHRLHQIKTVILAVPVYGLNLMQSWLQMGLKFKHKWKFKPVWIKPSALIICIAQVYKDAGWIFPFHNLKAENTTFCYNYLCFSAEQFLCGSQAFLSTDWNEQCSSVSCSTSHNPTWSSAACLEVFYTSCVISVSPTCVFQASWAHEMGLHR